MMMIRLMLLSRQKKREKTFVLSSVHAVIPCWEENGKRRFALQQ
jgi:hypothetical protein